MDTRQMMRKACGLRDAAARNQAFSEWLERLKPRNWVQLSRTHAQVAESKLLRAERLERIAGAGN